MLLKSNSAIFLLLTLGQWATLCIYLLYSVCKIVNACCLLCCRDEKIAIMRDKHSALMRPVVFALDHVCSITAAPAETPHETWFQQTYGNAIVSALERLRNPANPANPASSWLSFKQVCEDLFLCTCVYLLNFWFMIPREVHLHEC